MRQQALFLLAIFFFFASERPLSTELWIQPTDESGRMLRLSRAELYLDIWGYGKNVALVQGERGVRLPLDRSWPCSVWPEICGKNALWSARLILQAEGYAPVTSGTFYPFGAQSLSAARPGTKSDAVIISFQGIPDVRIREGDTKELTIPFRRPVQRALRIVDEEGRPLRGITILDRLLYAQSNHCGGVEGDTLIRGETNAAGELEIPDVNGECAFEIENLLHYGLKEESRVIKPLVAVREIRDTITTVVLRALEKRTVLQLEFTNYGIPAAGLQLMSCLNVACGAGCGTIEGETDQNGRVLLKDYYPEEINLVLTDQSNQVYWQGPVPKPAKNGWTRVDILKK